MSLAIIYSRAKAGINAPLVTVEVHISNGLPGLAIVGLPEAAVKESKDRVRSALSTPISNSLPVASPLIWPQQIYPKKAVALICPLHWGF